MEASLATRFFHLGKVGKVVIGQGASYLRASSVVRRSFYMFKYYLVLYSGMDWVEI
jgi:hypothetical protein